MKKIVLGLAICCILILASLVVIFVSIQANEIRLNKTFKTLNDIQAVEDSYELRIIYNECQLLNDDLQNLCATPADAAEFSTLSKAATIAIKQKALREYINDYNANAPKAGKQLLKEEDFPSLKCQ